VSLFFFAVAFLLIATFLKPKSVFGRAVHNMGIQKKVQGDVEQGRTLTRLSSTRSRSDEGNEEDDVGELGPSGRSNSDPPRGKKARSSSYQDLHSAGVVMDLEPAADTSVELSREELMGITGLSPESVAGRGGSAEKQAEEQAGVRGDASGAGDRNRGVSLGKGEEN